MKTVFILGAGASRQAGAPLMSDFLDRADELIRLNVGGVVAAENAFNDVFAAISELQAVHSKSYLDLDNIEILFGAIEMAQIIGKLGQREAEAITQLRKSIITLIVKTLEFSIPFPRTESGHISAPVPYDDFGTLISGLKQKQRQWQFSFLTFNYDLTLECAFLNESLPYDYWLSQGADPNKLPYLKLHGSINWGVCEVCKRIIPWHPNQVRYGSRSDKVYMDLGSNISQHTHCEKPLIAPPVLVPPTWNKTGYHQDLATVWKKAAVELASAENIFVIGYSLPETDSFFRYLFALGSESTTRIKRFWVFNPDSTIESRFQQMIGRGIQNRFRFITGDDGTFENAINAMRNELENL